MTIDSRFLIFLVWGIGTVLVYSIVLRDRWRSWRLHHDRRARRDLLTSVGLFLTALAAAGSIAFVLFGPVGAGIRGLFVALSLGAFFATGLVMATTPSTDEPR